MKKNNIKLLLPFAVLASLVMGAGCSRSMDDVNTNPFLLTDSIAKRDGFNQGAFFLVMQNEVIPVQENRYQFAEHMIGLPYGRYLPPINSWAGQNFQTFNPNPDWNSTPFNDAFGNIYPAFFNIQKITGESGVNYAWAKIILVAAMQRITDMYGPIPYTKVRFGQLSSPYDPQETVYDSMIADLTESAAILQNYVTASGNAKPMLYYDNVYAGDFSKWVRFANSLKLRMAMRMVYADAGRARRYAEEAVAAGVMTSNEDNAAVKTFQKNPIYIINGWPELRASAEIVSYLKGFGDKRLEKYIVPGSYNGVTDYYGVRSGLINMNRDVLGKIYSSPNIGNDARLLWMPAAEVAFLRAEGAVRGWNMGGTAESFYTQGVSLSFTQWELSSADATTYLTNNTAKQANYTDARGLNSANAVSTITVSWNEADNAETKLERIVTQKWIALFPLGTEAWSEYRRTGYPKFFPAVNNLSSDGVNSTSGARRLVFPSKEYNNNNANVSAAVSFLKGTDAQSTKLWWDAKN
ncbi:SusD/RagB family nutrient-binding outer membrane lipoprotein [Niabella pedocola]|uniref:SusD/RagB family nutrient-binding outer membrane lipoprotein n=1 Tax=Niabella pedocola TaxID=1752077 RepID=A0ABS8PL28_9BACT|nr:SusD/RagB family nutrient-binding outer membrane lipoprotein [Niabella pedocola]MCD2421811.1 SusD/RagB family nutrient-binding outer membrane lipoprotein [Niabella pedocola]